MACSDDSTKNLPIENCCWVMGKVTDIPEFENEEDTDSSVADEHCMLFIMDEKGGIIATDLCRDKSDGIEIRAASLLRDAMLKPMTYKPRRPKFVLFRDMEPLKGDVLEKLGISSKQEPMGCKDTTDIRCCSVCRREGSPELFDLCETCRAVYYCSNRCRDNDMRGAHQFWCRKMIKYMQNAEILIRNPFKYSEETGRENFDHLAYKKFLQRYSVYGRGFWIRELYCMMSDPLPLFGKLYNSCDLNLNGDNPVFLGEGRNIVQGINSNAAPDIPLTDWVQYYMWRNIEFTSPLSILMTFPMTVYYIITSLYTKDYAAGRDFLMSDSAFVIHLVGVEKEADMIPLFKEIKALLPRTQIDICMIGAELSKKVHGKVTEKENLKITTMKGCYHDVRLPKPNIVIGLNAGLGAYPSWGQTLVHIKTEEIPAYFTDYCAYSCECAKGPMEGLELGTTSEPIINPFRSPVRRFCTEQRMPWYSNAFIYRLMYGVKGLGASLPSHTQPTPSDMEKCYLQ